MSFNNRVFCNYILTYMMQLNVIMVSLYVVHVTILWHITMTPYYVTITRYHIISKFTIQWHHTMTSYYGVIVWRLSPLNDFEEKFNGGKKYFSCMMFCFVVFIYYVNWWIIFFNVNGHCNSSPLWRLHQKYLQLLQCFLII